MAGLVIVKNGANMNAPFHRNKLKDMIWLEQILWADGKGREGKND